jgi:hypothetical protein
MREKRPWHVAVHPNAPLPALNLILPWDARRWPICTATEALTALRKRQLADSAAASTAYQAGLAALDWYQGGEYPITDELGIPVRASPARVG